MANPNASHPDFTSDYVSFNIALNGRHLFRTDPSKMGFDVVGVREVLAAKFPASEGYTITRERIANEIHSSRIDN